MHKYRVGGLNVRAVGPSSLLSEDPIYVTVGKPKDGDGDPRIAYRGTYDDCSEYVERNSSPDNYERYDIAEVLNDIAEVLTSKITNATPGWNSDGAATLKLEGSKGVIVLYALCYLPETNEVVLLKGDEAVYSELLS